MRAGWKTPAICAAAVLALNGVTYLSLQRFAPTLLHPAPTATVSLVPSAPMPDARPHILTPAERALAGAAVLRGTDLGPGFLAAAPAVRPAGPVAARTADQASEVVAEVDPKVNVEVAAAACATSFPIAAPALSATQRFVRPDGAGIAITLSAYPAGAGSQILDFWTQHLTDGCVRDGASAYAASVPDLASHAGAGRVSALLRTSHGSTLDWLLLRRGDVTTSIVVDAGSSDDGASLVGAAAAASDDRLNRALQGSCADESSTADGDAGRSPWLAAPFTGHLVNVPVTVDGALPAESATPAPPQAARVVTYPTTDDHGVAVPSPSVTEPPSAPTMPDPAPSSMLAAEPTSDSVGPGCGWAFTGTSGPTFDQVGADEVSARAERAARSTLTAGALTVQEELRTYRSALPDYEFARSAYQAWLRYQQARLAAASPRPSPTSAPASSPGFSPTPLSSAGAAPGSPPPSASPSPSPSPNDPSPLL